MDPMKQKIIEEFWLKKLAGEWPKMALPFRNDTATLPNPVKEKVVIAIPHPVWTTLTRVAKNSDLGLFILLLTGVTIVWQKFTTLEEMAIGTISPRKTTRDENQLSCTGNILICRTTVNANASLKETVHSIKQVFLEAIKYDECSFETIYNKLSPGDNESYTGLYSTAVWFDKLQNRSEELNAFEIGICFSAEGGQPVLEIHYPPSAYSQDVLQRFGDNCITLLSNIPGNLDQKISELDILNPNEKKQLVEDFNQTNGDYPRGKRVDELFSQQAISTPQSDAVIFRDERMTYHQLHLVSNRLARHLKTMGVGPEKIVGLLFDRSLEMIVAIMGVLKAGGAYLPIDPQYPPERITYILNDSSAPVILTTQALASLLTHISCEVFLYETFNKLQENLEETPFTHTTSCGSDLAYIIYTSGSEGKPKGIMIQQESFTEFVTWAVKEYEHRVGYQVLLSNSYAFDSSLQQIFPPLVSGGTLHVLHADDRTDVQVYFSYLKKHKINNIDEIPVVMNLMFEAMGITGEELLPDLTCLSLGSDYVPIEVVKKCRKHLNHEGRIINGYGPAETSVETSTYFFDGRSNTEKSLVGKPRRNLRVYILDAYGRCCPIGVAGEICVSGIGLARGYLNKPEMTQAKFVPNNLSGIPGDILYKTGDKGLWQLDGNIDFLGRIDLQVKIRGYRIELGEIENCLLQFPSVTDTVVIARTDERGEKYLCAYIVSRKPLSSPELKTYLSKKVSEYMIPAYFIQLDRLPLTPNSKVDRKALPEPQTVTSNIYAAPTNDIEEHLSEIWAEILGIEKTKIGVDDDFFEIGGHSLKATILITNVHKTLNIKIPVSVIFATPTIRQLARYLNQMKQEQFISIQAVEKKEYYPLSSAQKRMFLLNQLKKDNTSDNISGIMRVEGFLEIQQLNHVINQLIKRHESLRTSFEIVHHEPVQRVHDHIDLKINYIHLHQASSTIKQEDLKGIIGSFVQPFDLSQAPLLRVGLLKISEQEQLLLYDMHHIISDGTSSVIFIKEFMAYFRGETIPGLHIQYKDFACWQNSISQSVAIKKQEEYWLGVYSTPVPLLNFPTDYLRPSVQSFEGDFVEFQFNSDLTSRLNRIAFDNGATLYMVLLAIYKILLFKNTNQEDIVVGSSIAGRHHPDLENIIGFFVNTLAVRSFPTNEKTFARFLEEIKITTINAYDNQDYQFDELVGRLEIPRYPGRSVLFDTHFTLHNIQAHPQVADQGIIEVDNLIFRPYSFEEKTTQFDIIIHAVESNNKVQFILRYGTRLFKKETIERLIGYYKDIANHISENIQVKLKDIYISHNLEMAQTNMPTTDFIF